MLGIHGVGRDKAGYYLSDLARELPAGGPGRWVGTAAAGLGLAGPVQAEEFQRLLEGRQPRTGVVLGSGRASVAAFDLTFSAPKSVSVLFALAGPEAADAVVAAHRQAVAGALCYLEQHALSASRRAGAGRVVVPTSGAVAAEFTHGVTRNGDPHVHSHVVLGNVVHGADGRWSACDRRGIDAHRVAAAAVYEAQLRGGLRAALDVGWTGSPGRTTEVAGIGLELRAEFSSRGADIRRHMDAHGAHSGRGARIAWAATRPPKEQSAPFAELSARWERRALAIGAPLELERGQPRPGRAVLDEHRFAGVLSLPAHGGAHRRDVVAAFGTAALDGASGGDIERLVTQWVPPGPPGVAEPLHSRRAVVPANHQLRALGPRPVDPDDHAVWLGAARSLDAYRERWGLARAPEPFGVSDHGRSLAGLSPHQLADHRRTERAVTAARARLGWREPAAVERGLAR
ncbi:MAG TPA: MobF family relaxase [Acidimicrobiales bacterium]|jgi:conjugative relaxase-like TrwC/TraI family protein|nr:MobF family relaxase [Acidimicrobiales bacterium]